jgi:hypothetical protein
MPGSPEGTTVTPEMTGPSDEGKQQMATTHTPADDIVYDLVSVQYHALQGAQNNDKYSEDAEEHDDVRQFFEEVAQQDAWRAQRCHELLAKLTGGGRGLDAG